MVLTAVALERDVGTARRVLTSARPPAGDRVHLIVSQSGNQELKILLKGYTETPPRIESEPELENPELEDVVPGSVVAVAAHLYKVLRGSNNETKVHVCM